MSKSSWLLFGGEDGVAAPLSDPTSAAKRRDGQIKERTRARRMGRLGMIKIHRRLITGRKKQQCNEDL